jgi:hypothetical protein
MRNLSRKWDKGIYDHDKAKTLWKYYADTGAKKYGKEHGANDGFKMFPPAVRRAVASELADNWHEELKAGNKMESAPLGESDVAPHEKLQKLVGQHFPVGQDGSNAITALQGIIDDEGLNADIQKMADEKGPDTCGRPAVHKYLSDVNPELLQLLDFGDMTMETLGGDASEDFIDAVTDKKKKKHGETTAEDIKRLSGIK